MELSILSYSLCLITYAIKCQGFTNVQTKLISHILVSQSLSGLLFFHSGRRQSMFFNSCNRKCPQEILEGRMALRFCVIVKPLLGTLFHDIISLSLSMERVPAALLCCPLSLFNWLTHQLLFLSCCVPCSSLLIFWLEKVHWDSCAWR